MMDNHLPLEDVDIQVTFSAYGITDSVNFVLPKGFLSSQAAAATATATATSVSSFRNIFMTLLNVGEIDVIALPRNNSSPQTLSGYLIVTDLTNTAPLDGRPLPLPQFTVLTDPPSPSRNCHRLF
jgi:hypothetical protein